MASIRGIMMIFGPLAGVVVAMLCLWAWGLTFEQAVAAGVTAWCAIWWTTEAVPIPVTALVPFVVFPFAGVLDHTQLALAYGNRFILLFMAGFMISRAAEVSRTHLRVSHGILGIFGAGSKKRLVLGFLVASALSSMWISNTATALILLPVVIAIIADQHDTKLTVPLLLAVAYGSSIGGITTLIGTAPNGVFASVYLAETGVEVDFVTWFKVGLPIAFFMLIAAAVVLTWGVGGPTETKLEDLGAWTSAQRRVLAVIGVTILLWITRSVPFGGWSGWFDMPLAHDATVGLLAVVAMFLIPSGRRDDDGRRERLLDWSTASRIPWGILLLFAGGLALAAGFQESGLAAVVGELLAGFTSAPPIVVILVLCLAVTFLTEITSNTATTTLLMPILAGTAIASGYDAALFMIPAAVSASCAFMLPVATPPNAIVFGSERITIPQMARRGVVLNVIGAFVITGVCALVIDPATGL